MSNLSILEEINKFKKLKKMDLVRTPNQMAMNIAMIQRPNNTREFVELSENGFEEIDKSSDNVGLFVPLLIPHNERHVLYCAGKSGDGKGVFVGEMTMQYHRLYPNNRIYYICSTPIKDDLTFSRMAQFVRQVSITQFVGKTEDRILKLLTNSLVIMDDNDNLEKDEREALRSLQKTILFLGRKYRVSFFKISHYKTDATNTRSLIGELDYYITFVNRDIKSDRLLKEYKKINKRDVDDLNGSLWAFFNFKYDYVVTNKKIFFLS